MLLKVTISDSEMAAIDNVRGQTPRATWLRHLAREACVAAGELRRVQQNTTREPRESPEPEPTHVAVAPAMREAPRPVLSRMANGHKLDCTCNSCERERGNL